MANEKTEKKNEAPAPAAAVEAPKVDPKQFAVAENALIGDEAVQSAAKGESVEVNDAPVKAQVTGAPARVVETSEVNEVYIQSDHVITDANSPEAVQIPDAGIGSSLTPLHGDRKSPEEVFADES